MRTSNFSVMIGQDLDTGLNTGVNAGEGVRRQVTKAQHAIFISRTILQMFVGAGSLYHLGFKLCLEAGNLPLHGPEGLVLVVEDGLQHFPLLVQVDPLLLLLAHQQCHLSQLGLQKKFLISIFVNVFAIVAKILTTKTKRNWQVRKKWQNFVTFPMYKIKIQV
jgi:hypothetical protein